MHTSPSAWDGLVCARCPGLMISNVLSKVSVSDHFTYKATQRTNIQQEPIQAHLSEHVVFLFFGNWFSFEDCTHVCLFSLSPLFYDRWDVSQKYIIEERTCNTLLCISIDISIISLNMLVQGQRGRLFVTSLVQKEKAQVFFFLVKWSQSNK